MIHNIELKRIHNPDPATIGDTPEAFLRWLGGPAAIFLKGRESNRCRAVCTLLHGNEPSGTTAVFNYMKSGAQPRVDTLFIIASVHTALSEPVFSHRMLPGVRDLNRCFRAPFEDEPGLLAKAILELIHEVRPESLIDIHNTSGSGPAFGVSICDDIHHLAITSLFTNDLIVTDLRLGALMELSELDVTTVTIECGGAQDYSAHMVAQEGLQRYLSTEALVADAEQHYRVNIFRNPIRLETRIPGPVAYSDEKVAGSVITLPAQAEKFNYGTLTKDECIAQLGPAGIAALSARDHEGNERLDEYFVCRDQQLFARHPIKVFMVTTNPFIAETDCLFYFIAC